MRARENCVSVAHLGGAALNLFKDLPSEGVLFPYLSRVRAGDRATEFGQRCRQLGITGITLHSYRYAWAERAKTVRYPERFAQQALEHNSKTVHHACSKPAEVTVPSLDDWEKKWQRGAGQSAARERYGRRLHGAAEVVAGGFSGAAKRATRGGRQLSAPVR